MLFYILFFIFFFYLFFFFFFFFQAEDGIRDGTVTGVQTCALPISALVWLAGMAAVLASPTMNTLMDDPARDGIVVAIVVFFAGGLYGLVAYWLLAAILHLCVRSLGSQGTYRRTRHLLGFAVAPVALALVTFW